MRRILLLLLLSSGIGGASVKNRTSPSVFARAFASISYPRPPQSLSTSARRHRHQPPPSRLLSQQQEQDDVTRTSTPTTRSVSDTFEDIGSTDPVVPKLRSSSAPSTSSPKPAGTQEAAVQPHPADIMKALGTSPRRIFLSLSASTGIALAANFLGVTSNLLQLASPELVESTGLDTYYPVNGFKRYNGQGYTLTIPKEWVADTAVELAKATRRAGTLDYGMKRPSSGAPGAGVLPDAAFGPPGKKDARGLTPQGADTNISIVISQLRPGFTLRSLGPPKEAAEFLLRVSLAPEGSGRVGTLRTASEEARGGRSSVYQLEYDVDRGDRGVPLRAISIIGVLNGADLITSTVVAPKDDWRDEKYAKKLRRIIESFRLK